MNSEMDESELLPFHVLVETGSVKFQAKERFVHTQREPRFFVVRLAPGRKEYENGYGFEVQLLDEAGRAGAVLYFLELQQDFRTQEYCVPATVVAAAVRQAEGKGDYVNEQGESRKPF